MSSAFEQLAEQRIEEAIANGLFDHLLGKGEELDLSDYLSTPEHLRMSHNMLKSNGFVPPEVELMREIDLLEKQLIKESNERACKSLEHQIHYKKTELAMAMERLRNQVRKTSS